MDVFFPYWAQKKNCFKVIVDKTQDNAHEVGVSTTVNPGTSIIFSLIYGKSKKDSS